MGPYQSTLTHLYQLLNMFGGGLDTGMLIFARVLAFLQFAPIFNRKDMPIQIRLAFCLFLTFILLYTAPPAHQPYHMAPLADHGRLGFYILQLIMNVVIGAVIGFIADMILRTVFSAGSFTTNQIGLSSAMMMDPASRQQVTILDTLYGFIGTVLFIHIGGFFWLIDALHRSLEVFPVYQIQQPLTQTINLDYVALLSANVLLVATQLIAPVMLMTMAVDIMLGVINRTAQQIPVFQLSAALKPAIGIGVILATLPTLVEAMANFFRDYARIF